MRYRRLGETDLMVSEVGLDARVLLRSDPETAAATVRAAIALGVTVAAWSVSDATEDIEPLLARAAGTDRGRLTLIAVLDHVPAPEAIGPQVEAIAGRLESAVDIVAFPGPIDDARRAAFEEARRQGSALLAATARDGEIEVAGGRIVPTDQDGAAERLREPGVACVLLPVADPGDLRHAVASASLA